MVGERREEIGENRRKKKRDGTNNLVPTVYPSATDSHRRSHIFYMAQAISTSEASGNGEGGREVELASGSVDGARRDAGWGKGKGKGAGGKRKKEEKPAPIDGAPIDAGAGKSAEPPQWKNKKSAKWKNKNPKTDIFRSRNMTPMTPALSSISLRFFSSPPHITSTQHFPPSYTLLCFINPSTPSSSSSSTSSTSSTSSSSSFSSYSHSHPHSHPPFSSHSAMSAIIKSALTASSPITTWTRSQITSIFNSPLNDLLFYSQLQHRQHHNPAEIQLCTLLSIKTGGCSEDCKYCAQSSHNPTGLKATKLLNLDEVFEKAKIAKANNSTRFCMGSAWREMKGRKSALKKISEMVSKINNELGMETCVTLGMIDKEQAATLKDAGLTAYNHNIDTSRDHYKNIISTRSFDDRLKTIDTVNDSGIKVCSGGILGMGETVDDHIDFLHTLSTMSKHPESLPINKLIAIKGTPMEEELKTIYKDRKIQLENILRVISTARLIMPKTIIRLAAGRYTMKEYEQLLCFNAGVNAIFTGEKMLTTMCTGWDEDKAMLEKWGYKPMEAFKKSNDGNVNLKLDNSGDMVIQLN